MKQLGSLLRWDFVHLQRNQMISVSLLVGAIYLGLFYLLRSLGQLDNLLVVMVFNDPILMSYLFAGVLLLFERDQHTREALSVVPLSWNAYLWSKALALSAVATFVGLLMVWTGYGFRLNYLPFIVGCFGTSLLFVWLGCIVSEWSSGFNAYLLRSVGFFIPVALPLLSLFKVWDHPLLYLIPSFPGILLLKAAFGSLTDGQYFYSYGYLLLTNVLAFYLSKKKLTTP